MASSRVARVLGASAADILDALCGELMTCVDDKTVMAVLSRRRLEAMARWWFHFAETSKKGANDELPVLFDAKDAAAARRVLACMVAITSRRSSGTESIIETPETWEQLIAAATLALVIALSHTDLGKAAVATRNWSHVVCVSLDADVDALTNLIPHINK